MAEAPGNLSPVRMAHAGCPCGRVTDCRSDRLGAAQGIRYRDGERRTTNRQGALFSQTAILPNAHEPFKPSRLLAAATVGIAVFGEAYHLDVMRGLKLLTSVILLASLSSCAETVGPDYAHGPGYAYGPAFSYEVGPAFYCCGFTRFHRFHSFHRFHQFRPYGGFHVHGGFHGGHGGFHEGHHR